MAQSGFTPISIYYSSTSSAVPLAGNLAFGELALNILDGKLYYKSNTGVVTLLATSAIAGGAFSALSYSTSFTGTGPATITDNSVNAALRITQTGTGNALLVEDSANPDSTPFVIDQIGAVGIGGTPSTGVNLYNTKDLASATATAFGTSTASTVRSSVTTAAYGFSSLLATEAVAFTLPTLVHYAASQSTFANTAVTTQAGFQSQSSLIGAVDNYGFFAANTAAVTAGKNVYGFYSAVNTASGGGTAYGIYAAGTAPNVFNGSITGTTGTFSGNVQMASANGGQLAGLRNRIINGDMNINQRNATAQALTNPGAYSLDRWYGKCTGTASGTITIGQNAYIVNVGSSNQTLRLAKTAGTYAGTLFAAQPLETANSYGLAGKQVTISFRTRSGSSYTGATPTVTIITGTGTNQSAELMITGSWTGSVAQVVTLTGTLGATFSTFSGTVTLASGISQVGVLFGAVYTGTTGSTNDYLDITEVQLEVGPVATPFEQRPIGMELALCQRYLPTVSTTSVGILATGASNSTSAGYVDLPLPVTPRVAPTGISLTSAIGNYGLQTSGGGASSATAITFLNSSLTYCKVSVTGTGTPYTANQPAELYTGAVNAAILMTGCEL